LAAKTVFGRQDGLGRQEAGQLGDWLGQLACKLASGLTHWLTSLPAS